MLNFNILEINVASTEDTRAVWKVRGLVAVRHFYAEGGDGLCQVVVV
jgi:hypothetical protein